eukprot:Nitzschia sp. Nitz4//scaffold125_size66327//31384//33714//NITZ4_006131-RA/size66327-augustus-gene-0.2-mRNA-1//1//CDS//3329534613//2256//frame0
MFALHKFFAAWSLVAALLAPTMAQTDATTSDVPLGGTQYHNFVAMNETRTCVGDTHARPFNNQIRGANLGGWMVLEPWITPSLFYQFLGKGENTTAFDTYTFCEVLGPKEANRQLRNHWSTWVTEDIIKELAESGAVNSLRLPIGDFLFKPYGPYANGCFDGALEYIDILLDWAYSNGLTVLLDVHTLKGSQNGFDNSGQASGFRWTTALNSEYVDQVSFEHWPIRTASWIGEFNQDTASYSSINHENIQHALDVIQGIVDHFGGHPAVLGIEPVNEPWQYTPIEELKQFYWEGYLITKRGAPYWKYIMHDSFRFDPNIWGGFMDGCPERAIDTHIYQAWRDPDSRLGFYADACNQKGAIAAMERAFGPIIVGEWSLATDNCAMWLNGFNDNLPGFPRLPCKYIPCSEPYMGKGVQPGAPVDPMKPYQGPYGTGMSGPVFGFCPVGRDWLKESSGNPQTGRDWVRAPPEAPKHLDDTDVVMRHLAEKKIDAFSNVGHGFYFWNFRTDLDEPHWSYMSALERGWIPKGNLNDPSIQSACYYEDKGLFKCVLKKNVPDQGILNAVKYVLHEMDDSATPDDMSILNMTGKDLEHAGGDIISTFFESHKGEGVTCDFGGIAYLVEENRTVTDDDFLGWDDDEYREVIYTGPDMAEIALIILAAVVLGSIVGFIIAMHLSKKFNKKVQESKVFRTLSHSTNPMVRKSFALDNVEDGELEHLLTGKKR